MVIWCEIPGTENFRRKVHKNDVLDDQVLKGNCATLALQSTLSSCVIGYQSQRSQIQVNNLNELVFIPRGREWGKKNVHLCLRFSVYGLTTMHPSIHLWMMLDSHLCNFWNHQQRMGRHFHDHLIYVRKAVCGLVFIPGPPHKTSAYKLPKCWVSSFRPLLRILRGGNCKIPYCFFTSDEKGFSNSLPRPVWY